MEAGEELPVFSERLPLAQYENVYLLRKEEGEGSAVPLVLSNPNPDSLF